MKSTLLGRNIKGSTFAHELAAVTIFTGPNFKGKSTRIEAAQLAVAGYVPGVSEKPRDIFDEFASGSQMAVEFVYETDVTSRTWEMVKGSVKNGNTSTKAFESFPRVAIDYTEFFGLSGPERAKFLFARAKLPDNMTVEAFTRTITANLKSVKLDENTPATEQVISDLVKYITERQKVAPQDWLANLISDSKVKLNAAVATAKRMESTLQGMTAVSSETTVSADCEAKLAEARLALDEANKVRTTLANELDLCRQAYRENQTLAQRAVDERATRARMDDISKQKERVFKACQTEPPSLMLAAENHAAAQKAWAATIDGLGGLKEYEVKVKEAEHAIAVAKKGGKCSECGHAIAPDTKRATAIAKELKALQKTLPALEQAQRDGVEKMKAAAKEKERVAAAHDDYQKAQREYRQLSQDHADLQNKLAGTESAHAAQEKLVTLEKHGKEIGDKLVDAARIVADAKRVYDTIATEVQQLHAERGKAQQRALVIEDCAKSRAEVLVLRELCKLLTELQAKLLEQVVSPLIANINAYCGDMLRAPLEYREGEIGFVGTQYRHKTMSGTERTVFYAACSCALAQDAPVRMVTMDEFDIDAINWPKLVALLCDLCATGKLDLALLAHTTAPNITAPNLKVISL